MGSAAKGAKRDARGRLLPGHTMKSPGRPALPAFLKAAGPRSLQRLVDTADGKNLEATEELVMRAQERVTELVYGKPGKARTDDDMPTTKAARIEAMEAIVLQAAQAGDAESARAYLAAHSPEVWGRLIVPPDDPNKVDTLSFVPLVVGAERVPS